MKVSWKVVPANKATSKTYPPLRKSFLVSGEPTSSTYSYKLAKVDGVWVLKRKHLLSNCETLMQLFGIPPQLLPIQATNPGFVYAHIDEYAGVAELVVPHVSIQKVASQKDSLMLTKLKRKLSPEETLSSYEEVKRHILRNGGQYTQRCLYRLYLESLSGKTPPNMESIGNANWLNEYAYHKDNTLALIGAVMRKFAWVARVKIPTGAPMEMHYGLFPLDSFERLPSHQQLLYLRNNFPVE